MSATPETSLPRPLAAPPSDESDSPGNRDDLSVRAAENARRVRAESEAAEQASLVSFLDSVMAKAEAATGLTRDQLKAMASDPVAVDPPKASRESVANRGVPEIHLRSVFDKTPMDCDSLSRVREFLDSDSVLLVLSGGVGTCKSGSAAWALTQRSGRFIKADDLGRAAAGRDEESVKAYRSCRTVGLLVIDDLGTEYADEKGWFVKAFNAVIDARYEGLSKTIITTNLNAEQFKLTYGERIADRIRESGRFSRIGGESVRSKR